jgi:hypothetical protein
VAFGYLPTLARNDKFFLDAQKAHGHEIECVERGPLTHILSISFRSFLLTLARSLEQWLRSALWTCAVSDYACVPGFNIYPTIGMSMQ